MLKIKMFHGDSRPSKVCDHVRFFFVRATSALKDLLRNHVSQRTIDENRRASRERVTADGDKEIGMEDVCFAHYLLSRVE